jgi:hypothetical protein
VTPQGYVEAMLATRSEARTEGLHLDAQLADLTDELVTIPAAGGTETIPLGEAFARRLTRLRAHRPARAAS